MLARMRPRSTPPRSPRRPSHLRPLRDLALWIGLALLLVAAPIVALRAPAAVAAPASEVLAQGETPTTPDPGDDDDDDWQNDNNTDQQPPTTFQPVPQPDATPPPEKGTVAEPSDSLRAKSAVPPTSGPLDTLGVRPSGVAAKRLGAPAERKPFFGIHPAVLFLGILVGHIFVVRAVD